MTFHKVNNDGQSISWSEGGPLKRRTRRNKTKTRLCPFKVFRVFRVFRVFGVFRVESHFEVKRVTKEEAQKNSIWGEIGHLKSYPSASSLSSLSSLYLSLFLSFSFSLSLFDPIPSPEERFTCSQFCAYFAFSLIGSWHQFDELCGYPIIHNSLFSLFFLVVAVHAQFTHVWLKLHSDFDLSFRDCQEKENRIMVAEQC